MGAIGDVTTILEKIPLWKRLKELPKETEELRARVEQLEQKLADGVGERLLAAAKKRWILAV